MKERASLGKMFSVLCCVLGVCGVVFSSEGDQENGKVVTVQGYLFVIGSTIVYSIAETLYGKVVKGDRATSEKIDASYSLLFLGFIGLWTFVIFWPGMPLLHHLRVETFELPWGSALWGQVILLVLDTVFNGAFYVGIYFSSPLFMSVGSILTVPCSVVTDKLVNDYHLSPMGFVGVFGIVLGFLGLNVCEYYGERLSNIPEGRLKRILKLFVQDVTDFCRREEQCVHKLE
uniref:EamA domain-containing protein n=1 Tax=Arcella intermedia TaxID=1963864 RepID=A0A6B2LE08_9EUKA